MPPPVAVYSPGAGGPIQSHAWSGDRSSLAIAPGGSTAHVYTRDQAGAWRVELETNLAKFEVSQSWRKPLSSRKL